MSKKLVLTERMKEVIEKSLSSTGGITLKEMGGTCFNISLEAVFEPEIGDGGVPTGKHLVKKPAVELAPGIGDDEHPPIHARKVARERRFNEEIDEWCSLVMAYLEKEYKSKRRLSQPDGELGGGLVYKGGHYKKQAVRI